ncbi:MAG: hypothetical protein ACLRZ6_13835 [Lachnospiraceae bacterium]
MSLNQVCGISKCRWHWRCRFTDEQAKRQKRLDAAGIRVSAVGSPIGKIGINDDFEEHMKKLGRIERIADILRHRIFACLVLYARAFRSKGFTR